MSDDIKRPNAALINREWLEAAKGVLSRDDLAKAVLCACEYVLYGQIGQSIGGSLGVVIAMIKPALDSDLVKYAERCARNAANAKSKPTAASGSEWQRVGANTTTTPTTTSTSTTTTTSISISDKEKETDVEKWLVFGYFWSSGSKCVKEECNAFWSYYEALGWKNNKGALIENKLAAARMWRRQFETGEPPAGAADWFRAIAPCRVPDYNAWYCYAGAERNEAGIVVHLRCAATFWESLRDTIPTLEKSLQKAWRVSEITFSTPA